MAKKPDAKPEANASNPKTAIIKALMELAASQPWPEISLPMIAEKADVSLADLRDHFPSKGSILGGFARMIDRQVLEGTGTDMQDEPMRDRLLDVMLRRFDALSPWRAAIANIQQHMRRDPLSLLALNQVALNSWRYMLAAAHIDTEDKLGTMRIQGAALVFARALDTWLTEEGTDLTKTMAVLDKELKRGEMFMGRMADVQRMTAPLHDFLHKISERGEQWRKSRSGGKPAGEDAGAGI